MPLQLGRPLGRAAGPVTQALELPRLPEVEEGEHGEADDRRQTGVGPGVLDLLGHLEGGGDYQHEFSDSRPKGGGA